MNIWGFGARNPSLIHLPRLTSGENRDVEILLLLPSWTKKSTQTYAGTHYQCEETLNFGAEDLELIIVQGKLIVSGGRHLHHSKKALLWIKCVIFGDF